MCLSFTAGDERSEAFLPHDESSQALYFVSLTHEQLNSVCRGCLGQTAVGPKTPNPTVLPFIPKQLSWAAQPSWWGGPGQDGMVRSGQFHGGVLGEKWSCRARSAPPHLLTGCSGCLLCLGSCALSSHVLVLLTPHHEPSGSESSPAPAALPGTATEETFTEISAKSEMERRLLKSG